MREKIKTDDVVMLDEVEFPIEISAIKTLGNPLKGLGRAKSGQMVMIRPVANEYKNKTFLGLYLGDMQMFPIYAYNKTGKQLLVLEKSNPAIYVFELKKVIRGYESWWGLIENEKQLRQITNKDIENIWYVKLLREGFKENKKRHINEDDRREER